MNANEWRKPFSALTMYLGMSPGGVWQSLHTATARCEPFSQPAYCSCMKIVTGCPKARPMAANEIPVFPLDASTIVLPGSRRPLRVASSRMCSAIRSLILPVRLSCSHLA